VPGYELWDYFAYVIFALALIAMVVSGEDNLMTTLFLGFVIIGAVMDKTYAFGYIVEEQTAPLAVRVDAHINFFGTLVMRALLFSLPLIAAFQTKNKRTRTLAGLLAFLGLVYALGRWYAEQASGL
jgi:hypothetical protein